MRAGGRNNTQRPSQDHCDSFSRSLYFRRSLQRAQNHCDGASAASLPEIEKNSARSVPPQASPDPLDLGGRDGRIEFGHVHLEDAVLTASPLVQLMAVSTPKIDVFLSHAHEDAGAAAAVCRALDCEIGELLVRAD